MIENRALTLDAYVAIFRRRLKIFLIAAIVAPLAGFLISFAFTPKYTSQALILVQGQKVPDGYVQPAVTEDLSQRVVTIKQNVLSRNRLQPMIERLGLAKAGKELDDAVDDIQRNSNVRVVITDLSLTAGGTRKKSGQPASNMPAFYVTYTARSPRKAQQVCIELTSMLLQEKLKSRAQVVQSSTELLNRQLENAKRNLDDQDSKLATFKKQYLGQLPGDTDNNTKVLTALNSQLESTTQAINRAQQDKAYTESLLAQQLASRNSSQTASDRAPQNAAAEMKANVNEPPEIRQLRLQVRQYQEVIAAASREQKRVQAEINLHQGRIALSPGLEEQYKQLTRDFDTAQKSYQDLLAKKSAPEMATDMERQEGAQQMTLLDPANLPNVPTFPKRSLFAGGGLAGGLVLGLGLALWMEIRDKAIRTEQDVEAALQMPTLVSVPWLGSAAAQGNGKRMWSRTPAGNADKKDKQTIEV
ncbi:MAG TPA: Wzz/FepE/Etk N-terminal domain-containing protein [Terriglobales bacterium]|nr:Wzz/FepE/Etk N-terminal domain-containing protein [Terriglobales bacterium]